MRIAVVGGSLAGLFTATLFARRPIRSCFASLTEAAAADLVIGADGLDAKQLLPRSFAAAIEATTHPFVQAIFDYETERMVSRRIAQVGDASFVVRPHTGMGIAKAAADALALRKQLPSAPLDDGLRGYRQERAQAAAAIAASGRELGAHLM